MPTKARRTRERLTPPAPKPNPTPSPDPPNALWIRAAAEEICSNYVPPRIGRHSLLGDFDTVLKALTSVASGNYIETACSLSGISKQTWYSLKAKGEAGEEPHRQFLDALAKCESFAEDETVGHVRSAAAKGPQFWAAGMTWLERRHPERYARRDPEGAAPRVIVQIGIAHTGTGLSVQVALSPASDASSVLPSPLALGTGEGDTEHNP